MAFSIRCKRLRHLHSHMIYNEQQQISHILIIFKDTISWEIRALKQYPVITKEVNSFRNHIKNLCVVFDQGLQTPRNNKSTRPMASCFHLFLSVWIPWSNTRTRF